ncbi:MAG: hypothetical protein A3B99_01940 [Candidatus Yanofskybacteria bacterium RIFCSPHIGHO2_02_FULL_44_12b]|nr:MAG: hypothetical protein A3B99_01940 [Candidatus Yanofskybacteria bacterium RIFCSPHIGHO2_02_FULL_44_12b]
MSSTKKKFYTWREFESDCDKLASLIKKSGRGFDSLYGIPRGGLILAVRLSHKLGLPLIMHNANVGKGTLIVDDIADSGGTMIEFLGRKKYATATLFYNKTSKYTPTYFCRKKTDWVVFPWEEEETSRYDKTLNKLK